VAFKLFSKTPFEWNFENKCTISPLTIAQQRSKNAILKPSSLEAFSLPSSLIAFQTSSFEVRKLLQKIISLNSRNRIIGDTFEEQPPGMILTVKLLIEIDDGPLSLKKCH